MKSRLPLVLSIALLAVAVLVGAGAPAPARAAQSPAAVARHILGHKPHGLAAVVVRRGIVRVALDSNYAPQSSIDPATRKLVGFDVDVADTVAGILGLKVRFKCPAWETIPASLTAHKYYDVSIGSMDITRARRSIVDFAHPYRYTAAQVVVKKGGVKIQGVSGLFGKRVGVEKSSVYSQFLKRYPQIKAKTYKTAVDALYGLLHGKLKFVLMGQEDARQAIRGAGRPLQFSGRPLFHARLAFAVGQGQSDWLTLLNYTVRKMHRDGSLSAMSKKWYGGRDLTVRHWGR